MKDSNALRAPLARIHLDASQARMVLEGVPDRPGTAAAIFCNLAEAGIGVGLIVETVNREGVATLTFTLPESQRHRAFEILRPTLESLGSGQLMMHGPIAQLSVTAETVAPRAPGCFGP